MTKINMAKAIKVADTKYREYKNSRMYSAGSALDSAVDDQVKEIWNGLHPQDTCPDMEEITGNKWEKTTKQGYDTKIKINESYTMYSNNNGSVVLRGK